jgi:Cu2+-containing amine oxidase
MNTQFIRSTFIICILSTLLLQAVNAQRAGKKAMPADTPAYVVLLLDQMKAVTVDSNYRPATLSPIEIAELEKLLEKCVADHNKALPKNSFDYIDLTQHKRQYVPSFNKNGEKQVWVNCFCSAMSVDWKQTIVFVMDGGSCFFNLVINLSKKECLQLQVNGVG